MASVKEALAKAAAEKTTETPPVIGVTTIEDVPDEPDEGPPLSEQTKAEQALGKEVLAKRQTELKKIKELDDAEAAKAAKAAEETEAS